MAKSYPKYGKPTDITENTFAFILGSLYADAAQSAKSLYEGFLGHEEINRWAFLDFCTAFNALFNHTGNLIENKANTELLSEIRDKFVVMAHQGVTQKPNLPKCDGCMDLYNLYLNFLKILQKSELMDIIKEANVFNDSGS